MLTSQLIPKVSQKLSDYKKHITQKNVLLLSVINHMN